MTHAPPFLPDSHWAGLGWAGLGRAGQGRAGLQMQAAHAGQLLAGRNMMLLEQQHSEDYRHTLTHEHLRCNSAQTEAKWLRKAGVSSYIING